jgi:hypothetical protein
MRRIKGSRQPMQIVHETLFQKKKIHDKKRVSRVTQVVEHLPSKCETLSLNPSNIKKKKKIKTTNAG